MPITHSPPPADEHLFGWDQTEGIVSVWADREGRALMWQRDGRRLTCTRKRFRPWLFAATLDDLAHLGPALASTTTPNGAKVPFTYHELDGPERSYRYLLSANSGRALEHAILTGAEKRLGRPVRSLHDLDDYYHVGPVEQYLMQIGRV